MNCTALIRPWRCPACWLDVENRNERNHARTMTLTLSPEMMPCEMAEAEAASRMEMTGQELCWHQQT